MKKLKVLIDATVLTNEFRFRGIGNLAYSLVRQLLKDTSIDWQIMAPGTKQEMIDALGFSSAFSSGTEFEFISSGKPIGLFGRLVNPLYFYFTIKPRIKRARPDVYLSLHPDKGIPSDIPTVVFVHDVIPYKTGIYSQKNPLANWIKKTNYIWALGKAKKADRIVTISHFSKEDIVSVGFPAEKIEVAHLAASNLFTDALEELGNKINDEAIKRRTFSIYNLTEPYITYVGGLESNKNVDQILTAFAKLYKRFPDLKLVIGGGEFKLGWDHKAVPLNERAERIYNLAKELKINHKIIFTGFIAQNHLPIIYRYAKAFIHLSKYEGFGLNVLDPQIVGTPVIAANKSSYPEVLEDSAKLVDPDSAEDVAAAITEVLSTEEDPTGVTQTLIAKGKENVKRFSWAKTAAKVIEVVNAAASETSKVENDKKVEPKQEKIKLEEIKTKSEPAKVQSLENKSQVKEEPVLDVIEKADAAEDKQRKAPPVPAIKKAVVLATYFHPLVGGMERVALDYAKFLARNGYETIVITSDRKQGEILEPSEEVLKFSEEGEEIQLRVLRLKRRGGNYYFYTLKDLYKLLKQISPEIIHAHGFGFLYHDFCLWRYKVGHRKVKIINTPHGPFMSKSEIGMRRIAKRAVNFFQSLYLNWLLDRVIAVNPEQVNWMSSIYKISVNKVVLMPPIMPQVKGGQSESLLEYKSKRPYITISSISRLADYKGFDDIITAFNEANSTIETKLIIAGKSDNYEKEIEKLINNSPRRDDIIFERNISDERRDQLLKDTDIFIFASAWEAFGIVIAEAMSYAAAIITSNTEGGRFLVEEGKNGYIFEYKDLKSLINHINKLITAQKLLREFQLQSSKMVERFSAKRLFSDYSKLISSLTSKKS